MDGGLVAVGVAVTKLLLRSKGLNDTADAVEDAASGVGGLRRLLRRDPDRVAGGVAAALTARLEGVAGPDAQADLKAAAMDVATLMDALAEDDDAVVAAATEPEQFPRWVRQHGGRQLLRSTSEAATPFAEDVLVAACQTFAELAPDSPRYTAAALTRLLNAAQLLPGIGDDVAAAREQLRVVQASLDHAARAQTDQASTEEVKAYLRARIADWDVSVWRAGPDPSTVERDLQVRQVGTPSSAAPSTPSRAAGRAAAVGIGSAEESAEVSVGSVLSGADALKKQRMLVVLGGPGSGKTWLARRYARESAQTALDQLEHGVGLEQVELPLLTTWDQWAHTPGDPVSALVAAGFVSGPGHQSWDPGTVDRLKRCFAAQGRRVLLVVDSLDEAADQAGQAGRLRELTLLDPAWRIVVTSRPAAWEATSPGTAARVSGRGGDGPRVVAVQDLAYPDQVDSIVRAWFTADPDRGEALVQQLGARLDLARVAVVPLLLTFYCLLTETAPNPAQPLPARRRDLYRQLILRLLLSAWTGTVPGPATTPDLTACQARLRDWAWHAVRDQVIPTGLGNWGDTFTQTSPPGPGEARALDHVAPLTTRTDDGELIRRFVHRTIQEHLVAEYLATLPAPEAADVLLPHLWFDPDWQVSAPIAIAAHTQVHHGDGQRRGVLLGLLLDRAVPPGRDPAHQAARQQIDELLLAIAAESDPDDWSPAQQILIHHTRAANVISGPAAVARSAHWAQSNPPVRAAILAALPTANPFTVGALVAALTALDPSDADRDQARAGILAALPGAHWMTVKGLVAGLTALVVTDADRDQGRAGILAALSTADRYAVEGLVAALTALDPSDADRDQARAGILAALPGADSFTVGDLVAGLTALVVTDADRDQARAGILAALPGADLFTVEGLVAGLPALVVTDADRTEARAGILAALPGADSFTVGDLVAGLTALVVTDADRDQARAGILAALPGADSFTVQGLVAGLTALVVTDADRDQARAGILAALPGAHSFTVKGLVAGLTALVVTDADRTEARAGILAALPGAHSFTVGRLVAGLTALDPSDADRDQARAGILAALPGADPSAVGRLVAGLTALVVTDADRTEARAGILAALPGADPSAVGRLVAGLTALVVTDVDRDQARAVILAALPGAHSSAVEGLVAGLTALVVTDADRDQARAGILAALRGADPSAVEGLVAGLTALVVTDADRDQARAGILAALRGAHPYSIERLVRPLRRMSTSAAWLDWLLSDAPD